MKVVTTRDEHGKVVYSSEIISDIVRCAMAEVKDVYVFPPETKQGKRSIRINLAKDVVYIEVFVKMSSIASVVDVASNIQRSIKTAVETNTSFAVSSVDVHVVDVEFEDNN